MSISFLLTFPWFSSPPQLIVAQLLLLLSTTAGPCSRSPLPPPPPLSSPKLITMATTAPPLFSSPVSTDAAFVLAICRHCCCCQPSYNPFGSPASHLAPSPRYLHHQANSHGQISHQNTPMIMTWRGENSLDLQFVWVFELVLVKNIDYTIKMNVCI